MRADVSAMVESQIVTVPGRVHRLLRPRAKGEGSVLDDRDIAEVETLIELVNACRTYAAELAINEATRLGFDYILLKPFTPSELRGAVDKVLASKA